MSLTSRRTAMARKRYKPEEIVAKLRQVDVLVSQGQNMVDAIRQIGVSEVTYYRWRQEFGGLKIEQVKRYRACPAIRPLRLSQGRRTAAPGGLDNQRQAGRAYLATRGAEGPPSAAQARQALAGRRIVHSATARAAQSCLVL